MTFISRRGKISKQKQGGSLEFKHESEQQGGKLGLEVFSSGVYNFGSPNTATRISENTNPYKTAHDLNVARIGTGFADLDEIKFKLKGVGKKVKNAVLKL